MVSLCSGVGEGVKIRVAAFTGHVSDQVVSLVPSINWCLAMLVHMLSSVACQEAPVLLQTFWFAHLTSAERIES